MEYLRDAWASDRRAEWSIWMVYSKVELPHHFISSRVDESSYPGTRGKALSLRKFGISDDVINIISYFCSIHYWLLSLLIWIFSLSGQPAQSAAMRAELHRRSIAQMRVRYWFLVLHSHIFCSWEFMNWCCFWSDQQSVTSRHVYFWRSFKHSYCNRRSCCASTIA